MIAVTLGQFILILGALCLGAVTVSWLLDGVAIRRLKVRVDRTVILCRICGVRYEAAPGAVVNCPYCGTPNHTGAPDSV